MSRVVAVNGVAVGTIECTAPRVEPTGFVTVDLRFKRDPEAVHRMRVEAEREFWWCFGGMNWQQRRWLWAFVAWLVISAINGAAVVLDPGAIGWLAFCASFGFALFYLLTLANDDRPARVRATGWFGHDVRIIDERTGAEVTNCLECDTVAGYVDVYTGAVIRGEYEIERRHGRYRIEPIA